MRGRYRPAGIAIIALADILFGLALVLVSVFKLSSAPVIAVPLIFGALFIVAGLGTWDGMSWAWYVLTFGGGWFGWYFAREDVKGFFGIKDGHDEPPYSGD